MPTISRAVEIDAPAPKVFAFVTTPDNLPGVWPSMIAVTNAERTPDGAHWFDWVYEMAGMRFEGHAATIAVDPDRRVVVRTDERGIASTFEYVIEPIGDRTRLTAHVDYALPRVLLARLAEPVLHRVNERELERFLGNVRARMELGEIAPGVYVSAHRSARS